ncbi:6-phosphofructokinase [Acerihabitans arboris]|uniref:6-phosphofructokinase n=1 Tax=Acerihabitans arboris TaxID=2691583 RepID=A0A845SBN0_9GAMM|nr:ATP-dependent 6-phosphofructokinase [Acerihabitans arboris]NDL62243.1 ATP-dependent 6-phosphofructokinase [Acerihabitans arboris]
MKKVAIIASGGDAVGINSAINALLQREELDIIAFHGGYDGIIEQLPFILSSGDVQGAVSCGRNLLRSARSRSPLTRGGRDSLRDRLRRLAVDQLVVFGGGGSSQAAWLLDQEGLPTVVLPMSIDNDIQGTQYSIGFNSAVEVVTQALDLLHNTAQNMEGRVFMLEVFGADAGHMALAGALAGGAHAVILPEFPLDIDRLSARLAARLSEPHGYALVVCAEGYPMADAHFAGSQGVSIKIGRLLENRLGFKIRHTVLGYCQRAASPSVQDRLLALTLAQRAANAILAGEHGILIGIQDGQAVSCPLEQALSGKRQLDAGLVAAAINLQMIT